MAESLIYQLKLQLLLLLLNNCDLPKPILYILLVYDRTIWTANLLSILCLATNRLIQPRMYLHQFFQVTELQETIFMLTIRKVV